MHRHRIGKSVLLFASLLISSGFAFGQTFEEAFPVEPDPFVGDWSGRWTKDVTVDPEVNAQIVALGNGKYRINLVAKLDARAPSKGRVEVTARGGKISFKQGRFFGEISGDRFTGGQGDKARFEMKKVVRLSPTLGAKPPAGADVLFDGSNLDQWQPYKGWELRGDGAMTVTTKAGYLTSKKSYMDLEMHVEFRTSFMPKARGQQRANSGVFVQDIYEVQVLDSYGLEGVYDECGALYKLSAPHVNACAPPLQWQTFDITYTAPRHDAGGALSAYGRMTVYHNGVLIHNDQELTWITAWTEEERHAPPPNKPGRIRLQAHGNYIQFRNIWVVDKS